MPHKHLNPLDGTVAGALSARQNEAAAAFIQERMKAEGISTQSELARRAELTPSYINKLLTPGRTGRPSLEACDAIARALNVSPRTIRGLYGYELPAPEGDATLRTETIRKFDELPPEAQQDAAALIETLWRLHAHQQTVDAPLYQAESREESGEKKR